MNENTLILRDSETLSKFSGLKNAALVSECEIIYSCGLGTAENDKLISTSLGKIMAGKLYVEDGYKSVADFAEKVFHLGKQISYQKARVGARFYNPAERYTTFDAYKKLEVKNKVEDNDAFTALSAFINAALVSKLAELTDLSDVQIYKAMTESGLDNKKTQKEFRAIAKDTAEKYNPDGTLKVTVQSNETDESEKPTPMYRGNVEVTFMYTLEIPESMTHFPTHNEQYKFENETLSNIIGAALHGYTAATTDIEDASTIDKAKYTFPIISSVDEAVENHLFINPNKELTKLRFPKTAKRSTHFLDREYESLKFTLVYENLFFQFSLNLNLPKPKEKETPKTATPKEFTREELLAMLAKLDAAAETTETADK